MSTLYKYLYVFCLSLIWVNIKVEVIILTDPNKVNISIPRELAEKLKKRAEDKGFDSLSDYATYILRQVASRIETEEQEKNKVMSKEDEERAKDKLRKMGYLK